MFKKALKRAFTIVELVVVIAVIAALAAVLIPTFANVINSANESADEQAVRNMNTALIAEEKISGTPKSPESAMKIIEEAGYTVKDYVAQLSTNVLYYDWTENRVLIWSTSSNSVTYPSDMAETYSGASGIAANWYTLSDAYSTVPVSTATAVTSAVSSATADDTVILQLQSDLTDAVSGLSNGTYSFYFSGQTRTQQAISEAAVTIDLNGYEMDLGALYIINGGSLYVKNGTINTGTSYSSTSGVYQVGEGSSITLEDVEITGSGSVVFPCGDSAQVNIINSTINTTGAYCVATNAGSTDNYNVMINISNSTLTAASSGGYSCAVCFNIAGTLNISDSVITGQIQGIFLRAGTANITNCTINSTNKASILDSNTWINWSNGTTDWSSGDCAAMGAVVVGNKNGTYNANAVLTISGCTLSSEITDDTNNTYSAYEISLYAIQGTTTGYTTTVTVSGCTMNNYVINYNSSAALNYSGTVYKTWNNGWSA